MPHQFGNSLFLQPFAVVETHEGSVQGNANVTIGNYSKEEATIPWQSNPNPFATQLVATCFSSVATVSQQNLVTQYGDLAAALNELQELNADPSEGIEAPVFGAACVVAASLMTKYSSVPKVFSHGPKSVVFNWSRAARELYLTVSSDRVSAFISTPDAIQSRRDLTAEFFGGEAPQLEAARLTFDEPILFKLSGTLSTQNDVER